MNREIAFAAASALLVIVGCQHNAVLMPNSDPTLNKPAKAFAEEAAKHFPYPADLERGGELPARAEIGYMVNEITLVNYSKQEWSDVELWVNKQYVLPLQTVETNTGGRTKRIPFEFLYNQAGQKFPGDGVLITTLELKMNGKMYDVPKQMGG